MTEILTGGCQCGGVRYEVSAEKPYRTHVCHCTDCRKQSGSAFSVTWIIPKDSFRLTQGALKVITSEAQSGRAKRGAFCPDCGSRIYNEIDLRPGLLSIKPGTLDDASGLAPTRHVWVQSKLPWVDIPEGAEVFERGVEKAASARSPA